MGGEFINCRAFRGAAGTLAELSDSLGRSARNAPQKARLAEKLRAESELLLGCAHYDPGRQDCVNCRGLLSRYNAQARRLLGNGAPASGRQGGSPR